MVGARLAAVSAASVTLLVGCGDHHPQEVDTHALELKITHDLANTYPAVHVTCPDHVQVRVGAAFECSVHGLGKASRVIDVRIVDTSGRTHWAVDTHL
jgi:hypothetical protein